MSVFKSWEEGEEGVPAKVSARPLTPRVGIPPLAQVIQVAPADPVSLGPKAGYIPSQALENPITGPKVRADAGSASDVSFGFVRGPAGGVFPNEDPNTGLYSAAADEVDVAAGGVQKAKYTPASGSFHYGVQGLTVRTVSATPDTVTYDDSVLLVDTSSVAITVNLPALLTGAIYYIKDKSGNAAVNNITITPFGGALIDGAASKVINVNYTSYTIICDGTHWFII